MLQDLSIRDFVLIEVLDLSVPRAFVSVTGETGAGKSLILQALRFVLGGKADRTLVRTGAEQATVSASFELPDDHPARIDLNERGLLGQGDPLTIRRVQKANGPSRVFINDQMVTSDLVKEVGVSLVEIHGQHDTSGLLNVALHGEILDQFAKAEPLIKTVATCFDAWLIEKAKVEALHAAEADRERRLGDLALIIDDLEPLAPTDGETGRLGNERALLLNSQKLIESLNEAETAIVGSTGEDALASASRALERAFRLPELSDVDQSDVRKTACQSARESVERALIEFSEARNAVEQARTAFHHDPDALAALESRLFALRGVARKHDFNPDSLGTTLHACLAEREQLEKSAEHLHAAEDALRLAKAAYCEAADKLSALRITSGEELARRVHVELEPLKLERAIFRVAVQQRPEDEWSRSGKDRIVFEIQTNPGAPFGALNKIASGGELARLTLALRVCLAEQGHAGLLIFDEVDQGVGGAVAAAVGDRLLRLADDHQVLAITHSPQVASAATLHWHVSKKVSEEGTTLSRLTNLDSAQRREEVARMLAGAEVTNEARAAADRLMMETV